MIVVPEVPLFEPDLQRQLRARVDALAKPPGSLGRIEDIAIRLGLIQGRLKPSARSALLMIFAGDHGLNEEGVSRYPASVTISMVETFLSGQASANAFASAVGAEIRIIDAGMAIDVPDRQNLVKANVRRGTRNSMREAAMTEEEVDTALSRGIALSKEAAAQGFDVIALGEMGIGNTSSAALIMHCLTDIPLQQCVGRGTGHDDAGLAHKLAVLERAVKRINVTESQRVLAEFGGCEIAMMAGAVLGAAAARRIILIDGFISTAAALVAVRLEPSALDYCLFSHRSAETGHSLMLKALGVEALLDLQMRLGEGTGALLAIPLVRAAARMLSDVATLEDVLKGTH